MAVLARRLTGKYLAAKSEHLVNRVAEIDAGDCKAALEAIMNTPLEEQKHLYNNRDIEK